MTITEIGRTDQTTIALVSCAAFLVDCLDYEGLALLHIICQVDTVHAGSVISLVCLIV